MATMMATGRRCPSAGRDALENVPPAYDLVSAHPQGRGATQGICAKSREQLIKCSIYLKLTPGLVRYMTHLTATERKSWSLCDLFWWL